VWGWRVPFLLAVLTLVAAIVLRYNMPESQEVRGRSDRGPRFDSCCQLYLS
jgi:predicted MFS family arabinose efflux permease